jgi:transcriptional regulator with XRE-family HTH domain
MKKPQILSVEQQELLTEIGKRVKDLRIEKKMSYENMAEATGVARNTYNLLEHGKINFQFCTLERILKYHNKSISDFFMHL